MWFVFIILPIIFTLPLIIILWPLIKNYKKLPFDWGFIKIFFLFFPVLLLIIFRLWEIVCNFQLFINQYFVNYPTQPSDKKSKEVIAAIIPAYNCESFIVEVVNRILRDENTFIVAVDGGSTDKTVDLLRSLSEKYANITEGNPHPRIYIVEKGFVSGRGNCMNMGAAVALLVRKTPPSYLLFLHGDTFLPSNYGDLIRNSLSDKKVSLGYFPLQWHGFKNEVQRVIMEWNAWTVNLRSRFFLLPYGDQALHIRTELFQQLEGFDPIPLMEDVNLLWKCRRIGQIREIPVPSITWLGKFAATDWTIFLGMFRNYSLATGWIYGWYSEENVYEKYYPGRKKNKVFAIQSG